MTASHFRESEAWKLAMQLARAVHKWAAAFPREERYGLTVQPQRAAVSMPSNIAGGNVRSSLKDHARFVSPALGSTAEVQTRLPLSRDPGSGAEADSAAAPAPCDRAGQMLLRLHQALCRKLESESRVPSPEFRT